MNKILLAIATPVLVATLAVGCTSKSSTETASTSIKIDGSSTVYPISAAVAEQFHEVDKSVKVSVSLSGTGGGFKKFAVGETDISDASRPIKEKEEKACADNGISSIEIPVAFDGLSVVVNKKNSFVDHLTVDELKQIWSADGTMRKWSDVRAGWPDEEIAVYGPGSASGTFDYFGEAILGKGGKHRTDYSANEDDNVLVTGVAGDQYSLGYFGFAYYAENQDKLKVVPIKEGSKAPVAPTVATINNGTYSPLSRPIFIYVSTKSLERPEVKKFVDFYIENAGELAQLVGYVALPEPVYASAQKLVDAKITGTVFRGVEPGTDIEELMHSAVSKAN